MAMTMHVDIVSAEHELFSGTAEVVIAPAVRGEVGIYPRHTQMITPLKPGEVRIIKQGGEEESIYVSGGILEVQPHVVTILSDTAVRAHDLDEAAAIDGCSKAGIFFRIIVVITCVCIVVFYRCCAATIVIVTRTFKR